MSKAASGGTAGLTPEQQAALDKMSDPGAEGAGNTKPAAADDKNPQGKKNEPQAPKNLTSETKVVKTSRIESAMSQLPEAIRADVKRRVGLGLGFDDAVECSMRQLNAARKKQTAQK